MDVEYSVQKHPNPGYWLTPRGREKMEEMKANIMRAEKRIEEKKRMEPVYKMQCTEGFSVESENEQDNTL